MAIKFRKVFSSRQNIFAPVNRSPRLTVEFGVAFRGLPPLAACYGEPIKENFMSKWSEGHTFYFRPAEYLDTNLGYHEIRDVKQSLQF
jgi:hypothetical protein